MMDEQKNLPGETIYDKEAEPAPKVEPVQETETEAVTSEAPIEKSAPAQGEKTQTGGENKKMPDIRHQFAIAALLTGIGSFILLFAIPLFGVALAAVGGVFGIVFGVIGRRSSKKLAWTGIIFSIVTLVLVLICLVLLCAVGWHFLTQMFYELSSGFSGIPHNHYWGIDDLPRGFDLDLDFGRGGFYLD
ncbi:MAG: ABC transporter ATP-binding protein [Ruminococcaceae bacterium]|nr:ABC transporter ATP-binding protein [Oscillospiraceae bacterium]